MVGITSDLAPVDNQHRKITGYRDLNSVEIELMNQIKEKAAETGALMEALIQSRSMQHDMNGVPIERTDNLTNDDALESSRCLKIAKENLQTGFMWFVRAIALPKSF